MKKALYARYVYVITDKQVECGKVFLMWKTQTAKFGLAI